MKVTALAAAAAILFISTVACADGPGATGNFVVHADGKIYDPDGALFTPRGANLKVAQAAAQWLDPLANCWGFNTVRIHQLPPDNINTMPDLTRATKAINAARAYGLVAYHDWHNVGAVPPLASAQTFFSNLATTYKNDPYVWFEVANEPMGRTAVVDTTRRTYKWKTAAINQWISYSRGVIEAIRATGNNSIIVVPSVVWAQDIMHPNQFGRPMSEISAIVRYGHQIKQGFENIVFSVHAYGNFSFPEGGPRLAELVDAATAAGHTIIFDEFNNAKSGGGNDDFIWSTRHVLRQNDQGRYYGWAMWKFAEGDSTWRNSISVTVNDPAYGDGGGDKIDDCNRPTNLREFGQIIFDELLP